MLHLLAPSSEGWCYHQLGDGVLLTRRQGLKQWWSYSEDWAEMEAKLKARQIYNHKTRQARFRHGDASWELRGRRGEALEGMKDGSLYLMGCFSLANPEIPIEQ